MLHAHVEAIRLESHRRLSSFSFFILFVVLIQTNICAQWSTDPRVNNAITTAIRNQTEVKITTDGSGGAIVVWSEDTYPSALSNIYAQCITAHGRTTWGAPFVTVCDAARDQILPQIISDTKEGAIIAWQDLRSGNFDIYAQRLNQNGNGDWIVDGTPICTDPQTQSFVQLAPDGLGGAFITWSDGRSGGTVYAQHINNSGAVQWNANGIQISGPLHSGGGPLITADLEGGAFIAWNDRHDTVSGDEIYAQRISASGELLWPQPGRPICIGLPGWREIESIAPDGVNGFLVSWMDTRSDTLPDVYAQRIRSNGDVVWTPNGLVIGADRSIQRFSHVLDDGSGGAFITWSDARNESKSGWDIYVQRVMSTGEIVWRTNGIPVNNEPNTQIFSNIISDGAGGAIIAWKDSRSGVDIYAQHINANGQPLWDPSGVAVSTAPGIQDAPEIVQTGIGGAIVTWIDHRAPVGSDIYAQNIGFDGVLGYPPVLTNVMDVPNDQGGRIALLWKRSSLDTLAFGYIAGYNIGHILGYFIYRGVTSSMRARVEASSCTSDSYMINGMRAPSGEQIYWEYLMDVSAAYHTGYSCTVPTLSDSGPQGNAQYYYLVRAYYNTATFWDSEPVIGSSVDNISPLIMGKPAAQLRSDGSVVLHWAPNRQDTDIAGYLVYHSSAPEFTADSSTCIGSCTDTSFIDTHPSQASKLFYRIAAQDIHGNIGQASPSVLLEGTATYTKEAGALPSTYALEQNYPNPFNPSTVIRYALPAASHVRLTIYCTTGSEAATLFAGFQEAGYHELTFDAAALASGMYFYRLQAGAFTAVRKMVIIH